jgi:hypothetical protein
MSHAYIGTSDREVAVLVSFSIHVSKLYKQTKKASVIENYLKFEVCMLVRVLQAERLSDSEIHRR